MVSVEILLLICISGEQSLHIPLLWFHSSYQPTMTVEQYCANGNVAFPLLYFSNNCDIIMSCYFICYIYN